MLKNRFVLLKSESKDQNTLIEQSMPNLGLQFGSHPVDHTKCDLFDWAVQPSFKKCLHLVLLLLQLTKLQLPVSS